MILKFKYFQLAGKLFIVAVRVINFYRNVVYALNIYILSWSTNLIVPTFLLKLDFFIDFCLAAMAAGAVLQVYCKRRLYTLTGTKK